jgi:UDP-glucuronate 4-epimerase
MHALVTGAAGFIGSTLVDALVERGAQVRAVDAFTDYYEPADKRANIGSALSSGAVELIEDDLRVADPDKLLAGVDVVFHQAGQPGVRSSWAAGFADYVGQNVLVTQRLLEAAKGSSISRFVYASSSSVYGRATRYPTVETDLPAPDSPYGVTKLAGEHLVTLYARNFGVPTVALRYFTVFGPRQRPDMAIHRIIEAGRRGDSFPLYGDGGHIRDFTFVDDVIAANLLAADADIRPGSTFNIAGGGSVAMRDLIGQIGDIMGGPVSLDRRPEQPGDVVQTGGDISAAAAGLGWRPVTPLADGLDAQVAWHRLRASPAARS